MKLKYYITFETLEKNITNSDNLLYKYNVNYCLVSNYPKIRYYRVWYWCFSRGIIPDKFYFGKNIFKNDLYSLRHTIEKIEEKSNILVVTDFIKDLDLLRDCKNVKKCNFESFIKVIENEQITKLKPYS